MGFPNVDRILVKLFAAGFYALRQDTSGLTDIFDDFDQAEQAEVAQYIGRKEFTTELRRREGSQVFIMPDFPRVDMPFPQIAVSLGEENSDRYMGDSSGESEEVLGADGEVIAWDIIKGYYAQAHWSINIVAATKDEAIWLSRCCQYFICQNMAELGKKGLLEISIGMADLRPDQNQLPEDVFGRNIKLSGTTENTWKVRVPASYYQTGANLAL